MIVLLALGVSGGIPNLLATSIVPAWATLEGWSLEAIGLLWLLQLPYALKFLWAPLADRISLPMRALLGQRRSWILWSQILVVVAVAAVALWQPGAWTDGPSIHALVFMALLFVCVIFSATHDIVADAYRAEVLAPDELGAGAGVFVSGYRVAFVAIGAGALALVPSVGWPMAVGGLGLVALAMTSGTLRAAEPEWRGAPNHGLASAVTAPVTTLWQQWGYRIVVLGAFVLMFRLPDQLGNAMTTPLLLKGLGYTLEHLGWARQAFGSTLTIVGALVGGWMVARFGILRCLLVFGILQASSNGGFLALAEWYAATTAHAAVVPAPIGSLLGVIAFENFTGGLVSAGFVAFLMSVCDRSQVATQYAILTALMALSGVIGGAMSGVLARHLDYPAFFGFTMIVGIPGILLIPFLRLPGAATQSIRGR